MIKQPDYKPINLKKTLARMKSWAKEKDRRYRKEKKFREKLFGPLIKQMFGDEKNKENDNRFNQKK